MVIGKQQRKEALENCRKPMQKLQQRGFRATTFDLTKIKERCNGEKSNKQFDRTNNMFVDCIRLRATTFDMTKLEER